MTIKCLFKPSISRGPYFSSSMTILWVLKQLCLLGYNMYKYIYIYRHTVLLRYLQGIGSRTLLPSVQFSSVQSHSCVLFFTTPWAAALQGCSQASLSFTIPWNLLRLMSIELPFHHLIFSCPLLLLPSIFPSIKVFSNELALCIRWPKDWSFSFSISPSNEHPALISFRMDWLDLLAVQGTLRRPGMLQFMGSQRVEHD